jgi:hypothetical protein
MAWKEDANSLRAAGLSEEEVQGVAEGVRHQALSNGYKEEDPEVSGYFGKPVVPDQTHLNDYFNKQFYAQMPGDDPVKEADHADTLANAVKSGLNNTIRGIVSNKGETPSTVTENSPWYNRAAEGLAQGVGDAPVYMAGGIMGGAAGTAAGPVGTAVGAAGMTFAFPAGLRAGLVKMYKEGGALTPENFMSVAKDAATSAGKNFLVGTSTLVAGPIGAAVGKGIGASAIAKAIPYASPLVEKALPFAAEIGAMTGVSSALDGKVPALRDFIDNAVGMAAFHVSGISHLQNKLMGTYEKTGLHPQDVASSAQSDPVLKQELMGQSQDTPRSLAPMNEPVFDHSAKAVVDGKLISTDKAVEQGEFKFNGSPSEFGADTEKRFSPTERLSAAKAHDPEAFKQLEVAQSQAKSLFDQIKTHQKVIDKLNASDEALTPAQKEEVKARRDSIAQIEGNLHDLKSSDSFAALKERVKGAFTQSEETLNNNLKDRLKNANISEDNLVSTKLPETFNPAFSDQIDEHPSLTSEGKAHFANDDDALHELKGANGDFSPEDGLHSAMIGKGELAYTAAPHLLDPEASADGTPTVKALQVKSGVKKQNSIPATDAVVRYLVDDLQPWNKKYAESNDQNIRNTPLNERVSADIIHSRASVNRAMQFIENGVHDPVTGEKMHEGLREIFDKIPKKKIGDFKEYLLYKQIIDENALGRATGVTDEEAKAFVAKHESSFQEQASKVVGFNNAMLDWAAKSGFVSKETAAKWKEDYKNYVPANRVNEDGTTKGSGKSGSPFKARNGSTLPYQDPFESMMKKASNIANAVEKNNSAVNALHFNEALPGDEKILHTVDGTNPEENLDQESTFARKSEDTKKLGDTQVPVLVNGQYQVMNFKDPDLARLLKGGDFNNPLLKGVKWTLKPVEFAANLVRTGVSVGSKFAINHHIRSELHTWLTSTSGDFKTTAMKYMSGDFKGAVDASGRIPFISTWGTIGRLMGEGSGTIPHGDVVEAFKAGMAKDFKGALDAFAGDRANDPASVTGRNHPLTIEAANRGVFDGTMSAVLENDVKNKEYLMNDERGLYGSAQNVIKTLWQANHAFIDVTTRAQRLSEYEQLKKDNPGATYGDLQNLGRQARRVSVDALQKGAVTSFFSTYIPFLQYGTQGFAKGIEAWKNHSETGIASKTGTLLALSAYAVAAGFNNPNIQNAPQEEKDNFWLIPAGDKVLKIAKDWGETKLLCSFLERSMNYIHQGDERAFHGFADSILADLPVPHTLGSAYEAYQTMHNNHNSYTGRNFIPQHVMSLAPQDRAMPYTSETARLVAKGIGNLGGMGLNLNAPMMVDYAIKTFTGENGERLAQVMDQSLAKQGITPPTPRPLPELVDQPYVGALVARDPTYNAQPLRNFEDEMSEIAPFYNSYKKANKEDRYDEAEKLLKEHPEIDSFKELLGAQKAVRSIGKQIQEYDADKSLSPSDRKQLTEAAWKAGIATAKEQLQTLTELRKQNKGNGK